LSARLGSLSFFFPALNEEDHVEAVVRRALDVLPRFADDVEVTVIDDGSTDRTGRIADDLAKADTRVRVVHHGTRRGYGGAVRSGLVSATKEFIFFTDGDRQFDFADVARLFAAIDGVDAVMGYRLVRQDPPRARFVAWVYNWVIRVLFLGGFRDVDCAFKLFRRDVFERVPLERVRSNGAFFSAELLITLRRAGIRTREVGVPHYPRTAGKAKGQQPKVILRAIRDLLRLRLRLWGLPV
jgi:glycosyltransferase involved in cell wall biosynthesis